MMIREWFQALIRLSSDICAHLRQRYSSPNEPSCPQHHTSPSSSTVNTKPPHPILREKPSTAERGQLPTAPIYPVDIGGKFLTLGGPITSTFMDGPGVALDSGSAFSGLIEIRAASLVGDLHVDEGSRRQDAYALRVIHDSHRIEAAVCDGAGSKPRSSEGSALIATTVVREAANSTADPIERARSQLITMASSAGIPPSDYSTTLIWVSIQVGPPHRPWPVELVQYGDGDLRVLTPDAIWMPASNTPTGNESDLRSFALPMARQPARRCTLSWHPGHVLVLASDGLSDHLDSRTKVGHFLAQQWASPPDRWQFLSQTAFRAIGAGDDRTAVALWRTDPPDPQESDPPDPQESTVRLSYYEPIGRP